MLFQPKVISPRLGFKGAPGDTPALLVAEVTRLKVVTRARAMGLGDFTPRERAAIGKPSRRSWGRQLGTGNHYYKRLYDRVLPPRLPAWLPSRCGASGITAAQRFGEFRGELF
jgi:hypothetical protein